MRRNFVSLGVSGLALVAIWIAKTLLGGAVYATAVFFVKRFWESRFSGIKKTD